MTAKKSLAKNGKMPDHEKMAIYLPCALAQELRIAAVVQRRTISAVAEQCIRDGLPKTAK
ncbi:MAG: hypothetical protein ABSF35_21390 [Polyangia bacterium]|jgi:hypothetical protein